MSKAGKTLVSWLVVSSAMLTSGLARAQEPAAAEVLFQEGRRLLAEGSISAACEKLKQSFALDAMSGTLLNLADCYAKDGKTATAWARFRNAASLARSQGKLEQSAEATRRAKALEPELAYITIVVPDPVLGLEVRRNDLEVSPGTFGVAVPSDPGKVEIVASAPGYRTFRSTLELGSRRDKKVVTVPKLTPGDDTAGSSAAAAPSSPKKAQATPTAAADHTTPQPESVGSPEHHRAPSAPSASTALTANMDPKPFIIGGVGAVALITGGVFGFLAMKSDSDAKNLCPTRRSCSTDALDAAEQRDQRAMIANIGFGVGVAGIATAAVWLALGGRRSAGEQHALTLHPAVHRDGAGVWAKGRF